MSSTQQRPVGVRDRARLAGYVDGYDADDSTPDRESGEWRHGKPRLRDLIWEHVGGVSASEKLMLLAVCEHFNLRKQHAYPSLRRLAKHCCVDMRHARRLLEALEDKRFIIRQPQWDKRSNRQRQNHYALDADFVWQLEAIMEGAGDEDD